MNERAATCPDCNKPHPVRLEVDGGGRQHLRLAMHRRPNGQLCRGSNVEVHTEQPQERAS